MANLIVKSNRAVAMSQLKAQLLDEVRRQGKPYGLIIRDILGGSTNTQNYGTQSFRGQPTMVFRVDAKTGEESLVRGVEMVGTPLSSVSKILATSDTVGVFNGFCGAESGMVPVSTVAPAILFSEIELQRAQNISGVRRSCRRPGATMAARPLLAEAGGERRTHAKASRSLSDDGPHAAAQHTARSPSLRRPERPTLPVLFAVSTRLLARRGLHPHRGAGLADRLSGGALPAVRAASGLSVPGARCAVPSAGGGAAADCAARRRSASVVAAIAVQPGSARVLGRAGPSWPLTTMLMWQAIASIVLVTWRLWFLFHKESSYEGARFVATALYLGPGVLHSLGIGRSVIDSYIPF